MEKNYLKRISMLPLWDMVHEVDKIESYIKEQKDNKKCICYSLEHHEEKSQQNKYIVVGAGKDGKDFVKLLTLMGKDIVAWCDNSKEKSGSVLYGHTVIAVEDALHICSNEIILIATRKFEIDILEQILNIRPELKNNIYDFNEIYARGMWSREAGKNAVLSYPPMWITIGVTSACPNKCLFCSYHGEAAKEASKTYGLHYMLSYKDFCKMIDMAFRGGHTTYSHMRHRGTISQSGNTEYD